MNTQNINNGLYGEVGCNSLTVAQRLKSDPIQSALIGPFSARVKFQDLYC